MSRKHRIAVIPGDGIGPEIIREGVKVLEACSELFGFELELEYFEAGGTLYKKIGRSITEELLDQLRDFDAIYFGAVGDPEVPPGVAELAVLEIRRFFDLYANVRPVKLYPNVPTVLKDKGPEDIDFVIVRENTEDLYSQIGGELRNEVAIDVRILTRKGCERIIRFAFELAKKRNKKRRVTCVDKSNVLAGCKFFRKIFDEVARDYPEIEKDYNYVDAATQWILRRPEFYDVLVTTNMFGDILSDMCGPLAGGLGMLPGGNVGDDMAMFEPIHGSAPKYAGKNVANPLATILAGKMMLEWLGEDEAAKAIERAVERTLIKGIKTRDIGGNATTSQVGDAIVEELRKLES